MRSHNWHIGLLQYHWHHPVHLLDVVNTTATAMAISGWKTQISMGNSGKQIGEVISGCRQASLHRRSLRQHGAIHL